MTALQGAIALAEMNGPALAVAQHLNFDMPRALEIFFDIHGVIAKCGFGLRARRREREWKLAWVAGNLHPAAAAARGRLDENRVADAVRDAGRFLVRTDAALRAGHYRNAEPPGGAFGLDLVAHQADMFGLRPNELHAVLGENFSEPGVLG